MTLLTTLIFLNTASELQAQIVPANDNQSKPDRDLSAKLGLDLHSLVSTSNLLILGLAGAASAFAWEETDENQSGLQSALDGSAMDGLMDIGNVYGSGWLVGGLSVGSVAAGQLGNNENLTRFGVDIGRSFVYSAVAALTIKVAVNRTRPSGGSYSFPSGHTTSAFSTVPVIWHHAGWLAGVGASTLASLTALGRMEENRHYVSDVIFGAAVGLIFGRAVISQRERSAWLDHLVVSDRSVAVVWGF